MQKYYYVYIMASDRNGTLYIGFTSNLSQRIFEHKNHLTPGLTSKYNVEKLVYAERFEDVNEAICHEKRLKEWKDLYEDLNMLLLINNLGIKNKKNITDVDCGAAGVY
ncbi:MAG: GIY-YIG nuclease family protein [Rickettsiales bacterium]|nr:GIY-YIG nuclease family protein [Rickettsiales bacterium]